MKIQMKPQKYYSEKTKLPVEMVKSIITAEKPDLFFTDKGNQSTTRFNQDIS